MQIFARLTKVDEATRTVSGVIANEALDRSGEVFDYESSKPHFDKWSADIAKATDGKSVGNVRAMHGNVAAGKLAALHMDDAAKAITVDARIVDDNEWNKVREGVYSGFSIGGKYAKQWKDDSGTNRYTAQPYEVSLVDLPCNPDAQFTVIKADGAQELRKFAVSIGDSEALAKWVDALPDDARAMLAKAVKTDNAQKMLGENSPDDLHATLDQCEEETGDDDDDALDALDDARDAAGSSDDVAKGDFPGHPYVGGGGSSAHHRASFRAHNATKETLGKGSSKASHTHAASKHDRAARSAKRAGADKQQAYHEHMSSYHTARAARFKKDAAGDLSKGSDDLQKMNAERDQAILERDDLQKALTDIRAEVERIKALPAVSKGVLRVVEKTGDNNPLANNKDKTDAPVLKADGTIDNAATALELMKAVYRREA